MSWDSLGIFPTPGTTHQLERQSLTKPIFNMRAGRLHAGLPGSMTEELRGLGVQHSQGRGPAGGGEHGGGGRACWRTRVACEEAEVGLEGRRRAGSTICILTMGKRMTVSFAPSRPSSLPLPRCRPPLPEVHTTAYTHSGSTRAKPVLGTRTETATVQERTRELLLGPGPARSLSDH